MQIQPQRGFGHIRVLRREPFGPPSSIRFHGNENFRGFLTFPGNLAGGMIIVNGAESKDVRERSAAAAVLKERLAPFAGEHLSVIFDNGRAEGLSLTNGRARAEGKYSYPLIGFVSPSGLLPSEELELDLDHTSLLFFDGYSYSDLLRDLLCQAAAFNAGLISIVLNGDRAAKDEVRQNLQHNIPVLAFNGTGGLADALVKAAVNRSWAFETFGPPFGKTACQRAAELVKTVNASDPASFMAVIKRELRIKE